MELLICHAEEIGRVPDELYERACLMSCFQVRMRCRSAIELCEVHKRSRVKRNAGARLINVSVSLCFSPRTSWNGART